MGNLLGSAFSLIIKIIPDRILHSRNLYSSLERKGFHLIENHYYQPIPDSRDITEATFNKELSLDGIDMNIQGQLDLLSICSSNYNNEYSNFAYNADANSNDFFYDNGFFTTVDAELLYCMIRHCKPANIIEIGSGMSTLISAKAIQLNCEENSDYKCNFICIEPFPKDWLKNIPEISELIESKVENLSIDLFSVLGRNDILFIDSSHIIKIYNDVCFEYLEVLPILNKGVFVHIHDIVLPRIYFKPWYPAFYWNEQYLLLAFLTFNEKFKIIWAGNFMHLNYPKELTDAFPSYKWFKENIEEKKRFQGHKSFWIQRIN